MKFEEDAEPAPRSGGAGNRKKAKKRRTTHIHVGPNVRAFRVGRAFCPVCNATEGLRLTDEERAVERASRGQRAK